MSMVMKSMMDKSRFGNTYISPSMALRRHVSSNLTTIGFLEKAMRSVSVNPIKTMGETKLLDNRNNFEHIDEAPYSESNYKEDREQSNTSLERDILNISAIVDSKKLTKKKILENISFSSSQHDIYNPDHSSIDLEKHEESENDEISDSTVKLFTDHQLTLSDTRDPWSSPIRIRKKPKVKSKLLTDLVSPQQSFLTRNVSQITNEKDHSSSRRSKRQPASRIFVTNRKKKKMKFTKKRKQPYNYFSKKQTAVSTNPSSNQPKAIYFDNFFSKSDTLFGHDKVVLATSGKNHVLTLEPQGYESVVDSRRLKSSYSKNDTHLRSAMSINEPDVSKHTAVSKRRNLPTTPIGEDRSRSGNNFRRIVSSYSSKPETRDSCGNMTPWSTSLKTMGAHKIDFKARESLKTLPKNLSKHLNSNKMIAHAYKSIPKESILKRHSPNRRKIGSRKSKLPPSIKPSENSTVSLLLKHIRHESDSMLPKVQSHAEFRTATNFMNSRRIISVGAKIWII